MKRIILGMCIFLTGLLDQVGAVKFQLPNPDNGCNCYKYIEYWGIDIFYFSLFLLLSFYSIYLLLEIYFKNITNKKQNRKLYITLFLSILIVLNSIYLFLINQLW